MEAQTRKYENKYATKTASPAPAQKQNTPIKKFRAGAISATIWENQTVNAEGQTVAFKNVSFERSYKDAKGEWQNTNALRMADLPKAILVLNKAYEYLAFNNEEESAY